VLGKNRDVPSIVVDILNAAEPGCSKIRIMGQANLSFSLLEKYLAIQKQHTKLGKRLNLNFDRFLLI
jgi:hypothetical protein